MLRIYQKDILKNGRLIASHTMMLIVKDEKELKKEEVKAQARYSMMINPPTVKFHARPIHEESIKDYGVQLKLF